MGKPKLIIFDADSIIWTLAYKFRNKKVKQLLLISLRSFIDDILSKSGAEHYVGFLGSKEEGREPNFRFNVHSEYKANRPPEPDWITKWRPVMYKELVDELGFQLIEGMEADDACAIAADRFRDEYKIIIASPDKDLRQIPDVEYYNYQKHTIDYIDPIEADRSLGEQVLQGDSTDNIKGLPNIGKVKAKNLLASCSDQTEIKWTVMRMYAEYSEELRNKELRKILAEKRKTAIEDYDTSKYSSKQIERFVRIDSESQLDDIMETLIPGGWKNYFRQQYALVKLLRVHDSLVINDPREVDLEEKESTAEGDEFMYKSII